MSLWGKLTYHVLSYIKHAGEWTNLAWKLVDSIDFYNYWHRSKRTSKPLVPGLCAGNSPLAGEFPAQKLSNAENVSIWWLHRVNFLSGWKIQGTSIYGFWICVPRLIWVVFFDLRPNKRLNKLSWGWWSGTPSRLLWRHCNEIMQQLGDFQDILDIDRHIKHQGAKIYARSHCSVITINHFL